MSFKLEKIRCWKLKVYCGEKEQEIYITFPENEMGYKLISCLKCGKIYSANITKEIYIGPDIETLMSNISCEECGSNLGINGALYPEKYLGLDKLTHEYKRSLEIPDDKDSIICEFPELYSSKK